MYFAGDVNKWESVCLVNDGPPLNKNHYYGPKVTHNASSIEIIKSILGSNELTGNYQCWAHFVNGKWECNQSAPIPAGLPVQQCP